MLFNTATVLALLPVLALATPFPQNAGNSVGSNMCDASTFNDGTDFNIIQAKVEDCQQLVKAVNKFSTYSVSQSWARPYQYGDCSFNVRVIAGSKHGLVGGADAVDLLNDSISRFQQQGGISSRGQFSQVVSAEGKVSCNAAEDSTKVRVEWIVASSGYNPQNN